MVHKKKETTRAYNVVAKIICTIIPIKCSQKNNSKWSIRDFFYGITAMCNGNSYAESAMNELAAKSDNSNPCGRWIRNAIQSIPEQSILIGLSDGIDSTITRLKKLGMFRKPVTVAIDKHFIPRYDKTDDDPYLVKSRSKSSTTTFEGYGTIQCVDESCRAQIGAIPIKKGHSKADIVRKLINDGIRNCIKIRLVLLDREFFSTGVIHELKQNHCTFIIPAKKTPGIKKAIISYVDGNRESISQYTIHSASGHVESFTLVIISKPNPKKSNLTDQYIVFATNIPTNKIFWNLHCIPDEYRKRWGIETGYACVGKFRPRTTSKSHSMRFMCFFYPLILFNVWIIANRILAGNNSCCKPTVTIHLLKCFIGIAIVDWFADRGKYHLECKR